MTTTPDPDQRERSSSSTAATPDPVGDDFGTPRDDLASFVRSILSTWGVPFAEAHEIAYNVADRLLDADGAALLDAARGTPAPSRLCRLCGAYAPQRECSDVNACRARREAR